MWQGRSKIAEYGLEVGEGRGVYEYERVNMGCGIWKSLILPDFRKVFNILLMFSHAVKMYI